MLDRSQFLKLACGAPAAAALLSLPIRAFAETRGNSGEYTFAPEESLTLADIQEMPMPFTNGNASPVIELGGSDRYQTSAREALYAFPSSEVAIVASGAGYADSICAAGLAGALDCPIVLTEVGGLPAVTRDALASMGVGRVVLLGSESVASAQVEADLEALVGAGNVERVFGPDRYATQMEVYRYGAERGLWSGDTAVVASAEGFADALSASPVSFRLKAPVLFCDASGYLPAAQEAEAERMPQKNFLLIGSTVVTSNKTEEFLSRLASQRGGVAVRLGGATRYGTSAAVASYAVNNLGFSWDGVAFASGRAPYDALGGGAVQGRENSVLLLADEVDGSTTLNAILSNGGRVDRLKFFGSTVVVSAPLRAKICNELGVPFQPGTSYTSYGITRSRMAELQVARNEGNGYTYGDFYSALDPSQHAYGSSAFYQFAILNKGRSGIAAEAIDSFIAANCSYSEQTYGGTSALRGSGAFFVEAGKTYGIHDVYLLAHAIWESGWGASALARGWVPETDGEVIVNGVHYPYYRGTRYHNFFGIGAVDSNALAGGRAMAVKEGWTSPRAAILGAAKWITDNYHNRSTARQNTLYLMKWDVGGAAATGSAWHEYCTGLDSWVKGIASIMGKCYLHSGVAFSDAGLSFDIPLFSGE